MKVVIRATRLAVIAIIACSSVLIDAQNAARVSDKNSISISLAMEKPRVSVGASVMAILTVNNLTAEEIEIHDFAYRVYVEGEQGEPPTTLVQRQMTGRLKPGDVPLRADEMSLWTIAPEKSGLRKLQLTYLYDLSAPGKYSVHAEVMDPSSNKWLRTNSVEFTVQGTK